MPYSNRHIIEKPRPYRILLIIISTICLTVLTQWYFFNHKQIKQQQSKLVKLQQKAIEQLQQKIEQLTLEKEHLLKLEGIAATAQSELSLEKATTNNLKQQVKQLQQKVFSQNEIIQFYHSITDGNASTKLQFRELDLRVADPETDMIDFRLIVSQGEKITRPITGKVFITLNFKQNKNTRHQVVGEYPLNLRLVQVIEGRFRLLDKQIPTSVTVTLKQKNKVKLTKTFDWHLRQHFL